MANKIILKVENLSHVFADAGHHADKILSDISFTLQSGKFYAIVGQSGSGKSTLLRLLAGLLPPTHGAIERNYTNLALVFQNYAVFPWLTVWDNVDFGLKMRGVKAHERRRIVSEKIEEVGLRGYEHHYPKALSGGMRQRVGIARALAINPDILLLDEPFSSLDTITAKRLKDDILKLWQKYGMTILIVTHLVEESIELADEIMVLGSNPGQIKLKLEVKLPRPRDRRSTGFYALVDKITATIAL